MLVQEFGDNVIGLDTSPVTGMVVGAKALLWQVCCCARLVTMLTASLQPGGQDKQLVAPDLSTHLDASYLLQTHDHPPAYISVRNEGWRVGPRDTLEKLDDPAQADEVDPKTYSFRLYIHMETGDTRYLHLNTGMWIGSGIRRGTEGMDHPILPDAMELTSVPVIYDAYRVI